MIRILLSTRLGERRWTQADLARSAGIRPSTINDMYHEIAERVNLEHLDLTMSDTRMLVPDTYRNSDLSFPSALGGCHLR